MKTQADRGIAFRNLLKGDTFEFHRPNRGGATQVDRCMKISPRKYRLLRDNSVHQVGTIKVIVYNAKVRGQESAQ